MSDVWYDRDGKKWYGYWLKKLNGTWGYLLHWSGADTDMGDLSMEELEEYLGPIVPEGHVSPTEVTIRKAP